MSTSQAQTCEVKVEGAWRAVSLNEARLLPRDTLKRCPICHGRVTVMGVYSAQEHLTLSHRRSHDGCPSSPRPYAGVPKRHPETVE
jgi:hypothetical protein